MFELGLLPAEVVATQGTGVLTCSLGVSLSTKRSSVSIPCRLATSDASARAAGGAVYL